MFLVHVSQHVLMREAREAVKSVGRRKGYEGVLFGNREPDRLLSFARPERQTQVQITDTQPPIPTLASGGHLRFESFEMQCCAASRSDLYHSLYRTRTQSLGKWPFLLGSDIQRCRACARHSSAFSTAHVCRSMASAQSQPSIAFGGRQSGTVLLDMRRKRTCQSGIKKPTSISYRAVTAIGWRRGNQCPDGIN